MPFPSSPLVPWPQQRAVPSVTAAHEVSTPVATLTALLIPVTVTRRSFFRRERPRPTPVPARGSRSRA
jgi:hypothetical protein